MEAPGLTIRGEILSSRSIPTFFHSPAEVGGRPRRRRVCACAPKRARIASDADVDPRSPQRPLLATTLRLLAAAFVLVALLVPRGRAEAAVVEPPVPVSNEDGGSCGEAEEVETVTCGAATERRFDEPLAVTLMREAGLELSAEMCHDLLDDFWAEQTCVGSAADCGEMNNAAPPSPGPKLASSSTSAQVAWAGLDLGQARLRGLLAGREHSFASRDLQPPVPPPRLQA